ncbi:hypothetical protein ATCC90586_003504 [Pythium insidiosum]|nr:hypothetical protein ATCC90586_003504 [Pythium insidiosum]
MDATTGKPVYRLDMAKVHAVSQLVHQADMTLSAVIRLCRGQTPTHPTPNKAMLVEHLAWLLHDYPDRQQLLAAARHGVRHPFKPPPTSTSTSRPKNHESAHAMHNALVRSVRDGHLAGTYLVLDAEGAARFPQLRFSPFGCVAKRGADPDVTARLIHDLSFPRGASTNDWSDHEALPDLVFRTVDAIARRIVHLRSLHPHVEIKLMKGDVKSAFRNIFVHEDTCAYFAGRIPEYGVTVVDLALPFGWTGSPAHYGVFGRAITHLVQRESPHRLNPSAIDDTRFFCFDWVDDHILVECDIDDRLDACETALRLAIIAVLGPRAINEDKFTAWSTRQVALGLEWDTTAMTVSMPADKIAKALGRVSDMLNSNSTSRIELSKLLGSLRHPRPLTFTWTLAMKASAR